MPRKDLPRREDYKASWSRVQAGLERDTPDYWQRTARDGVCKEDWWTITCPCNDGYGPCGGYQDWGSGICHSGEPLFFEPWEAVG